ncbi:semaphorin-5A [Lingula anatina]|uniref:Semaphorin-5A n=1 Tax=Lingula anatina TaxID=7574 RepID=A0A1S3K1J4_LINAN|nr:semaphorin-5A [Lingula anatina]|eukprot:XP_013416264.1 semaphorin-5A [Lingula anatina]
MDMVELSLGLVLLLVVYGAGSYSPKHRMVAQWGPWSVFTQCTASCGGGIKVRTRSCDVYYTSAKGNGYDSTTCPGVSVEVLPCNTKKCVIYGGWAPWSIFSGCCHGSQIRHRSCSAPVPVNAPECKGDAVEVTLCSKGAKETCGGCPSACPKPYKPFYQKH